MSNDTEQAEKEARIRARVAKESESRFAPRIGGDAHVTQPKADHALADYEESQSVDPKTLIPLPDNDRIPKLSEVRRDALLESIKKNGIRTPLIVDRTSRIVVCGNNRLSISLELTINAVPVIWRDITESDRLQYAIRDNAERRQMTEAEINGIITRYIPELSESIKRNKTARAEAMRGGKRAPIMSAHEAIAQKIEKDTGIKTTARRVRTVAEKAKKEEKIHRSAGRGITMGTWAKTKGKKEKKGVNEITMNPHRLYISLSFHESETYKRAEKAIGKLIRRSFREEEKRN